MLVYPCHKPDIILCILFGMWFVLQQLLLRLVGKCLLTSTTPRNQKDTCILLFVMKQLYF